MNILPDDALGIWRGSIDWEPIGDMWQPWRLPVARIATAHAPALEGRARMAAGIRAMLRTDASAMHMDINATTEDVTALDVFIDDQLWKRQSLAIGKNEIRFSLPHGMKSIDVWLPQYGEIQIGPLVLEDATVAQPRGGEDHRWITYGSSITQCRSALGPSETWPALVARHNHWDLTCLGFGGQCHLDPIAAETIANAPADIISLCLGINIYGQSSFGPHTLGGQVSAFIETVRDAHQEIPIVVISPIASPEREQTANAVGLTLADVRYTVFKATELLQRVGDDHLYFIDGLSILGLDDESLLADGLHPGPIGYREMATRIGPKLKEFLSQKFQTQ